MRELSTFLLGTMEGLHPEVDRSALHNLKTEDEDNGLDEFTRGGLPNSALVIERGRQGPSESQHLRDAAGTPGEQPGGHQYSATPQEWRPATAACGGLHDQDMEPGVTHQSDEELEQQDKRSVRRKLDMDTAGGAQSFPLGMQAGQGVLGPPPSQPPGPLRPPPRRTLAPGCVSWPPGLLHRIQLINFMCHENLEVKFGKHVTFVSGHNGSGKSAVLQGLQACLGAKARHTGRGSNLGEWVKNGKRMATVTLEIWNSSAQECPDSRLPAFRYELYGSLIRLVRKITVSDPEPTSPSRTVAATYQLYASDGREVRREQLGHTVGEEVRQMCDHFNIDTSNPLLVITQDNARAFHQNVATGRKCRKYEMYMEGTCLQATRQSLMQSAENVARAEGYLTRNKQCLAKQLAEKRQLEQQLEKLHQADKLKQLREDLERALVWRSVERAEAQLAEAVRRAAGGPAQVAQLQAEVEELQQQQRNLQEEEKGLREAMNLTRGEAMLGSIQTQQGGVSTARQQVRRLTQQRAELQGRLADLQADQEAREGELAAQRSEDVMRKVAEHQDKVRRKSQQLLQLKDQATQLEARRLNIRTALTEAAAKRARLRAARDAAQATFNEARATHQELTPAAGTGGAAAGGSRGPSNASALQQRLWGAAVVRLQGAVHAARPGTFTRPPIGPVGQYLRRLPSCEPRYERCLEVALEGVMEVWLVHCRGDADALRGMADAMGVRRPHVVVCPYRSQPHNYGAQPVVDRQGRVWSRVIDVVGLVEGLSQEIGATVMNCLLDSAHAASTVLVPDRDTGHAVAQGQAPGLQERDVRKAYGIEGSMYERRGSTLVTTPNNLPRMLRLAVDNSTQLAASARDVEAAAEDLAIAQSALTAAESEVAELEEQHKDLQRQQRELATREGRCEVERNTLLAATPAADTEALTADMLNQLASVVEAISKTSTQVEALDSQVNNAKEELRQREAMLADLKQKSVGYMARRNELVGQLEALAERKREVEEQLAVAREKLARQQEHVRRGQEMIEQFEREKVEGARADANKLCNRQEGAALLQRLREMKARELAHRPQREAALQDAFKHKSLEQWARRVSEQIAVAERDAGGDVEAVRIQLADLQRQVEKRANAITAAERKVKTVKAAQYLREIRFDGLRSQVDRRADLKFRTYMSRRDLDASLHVDHEHQVLRLDARRRNDGRQAGSSVMQLSGGERSITTCSFLLAMGEVVDTPFRAMDEYDVYMDASSRKITTRALLEYAWHTRRDAQLILLSPQDTATVTESWREMFSGLKEPKEAPPADFIRITYLADPRQATLGVRSP